MPFLGNSINPLIVRPGGFVKRNHLYECEEIRILEDHHQHLLWLFYIRDGNTILIHVRAMMKDRRLEHYMISTYDLEEEHALLFLENDNTVEEYLETSQSIWQTSVKNKCLLSFVLKSLSDKLWMNASNSQKVKRTLERMDQFIDKTIVELEKGLTNILAYISKQTMLDEHEITGAFMVHDALANPVVSGMEGWHLVWQLYLNQKHSHSWHEVVEWLRHEVKQYRKR